LNSLSDETENVDQMNAGDIETIKSAVSIPILASEKTFAHQGYLAIPNNPKGLIVFAHGNASGRNSSRNSYVAESLNRDGLATLLVDLLTPEEDETDIIMEKQREVIPNFVLNKFNIKLLASRLVSITEWVIQNPSTRDLLIGYFGESTGTAAALLAAATSSNTSNHVAAIVSRSGRPDLVATCDLRLITIPTLFVVGGSDCEVINWNEKALGDIGSEKKKMVIVAKATHLFEEPESLQEVARLGSGWFRCFFQIEAHKNPQQ
jgi:putative phosphoribosyl transferase